METIKIEEKVYQALKTDEELLSKLAEREDSIFHIQAPAIEETQYPCIVYNLVSCPPIFWSDNLVREYLASFRIWILTTDGNYSEIADDIHRIMESLGAARYQTDKYRENKEIIKIMDYRMRVKAEDEQKPPVPIGSDTGKHECHCTTETTKINLVTNDEIDIFFEDLEKEGN